MSQDKIQTALIEAQEELFPGFYFDHYDESSKFSGVSYSCGVDELDGEMAEVTIYIDNETLEIIDVLVEEPEEF